ncbi:MAG: hypothetical protein QF692_09810 [Alphaproteobacteria bacterium]|nr:hypothetical protein [Alphaproteobacteria bacterium]MDP7223542.1 hypothetical protein [Alphaproteobacteria bacterium]
MSYGTDHNIGENIGSDISLDIGEESLSERRVPGRSGMTRKDLKGMEQGIADMFLFFAQALAVSGQENIELTELLMDILGFDDPSQMDGWVQDMQQNGWEWSDDHDFSNFDFDGASAMNGSLLDLISEHESGGSYTIIYGGRHVDLTEMTVDEVLRFQEATVASGSPSSAVGRYQIIHKTLDGLKDEMGLRGDEPFDEAMQDRMATVLLNRRGYDDYLSGEIGDAEFMRNLSQEWASLPKDMGGRSYYAGDGLNKALTSPEAVLAAMRGERDAARSSLSGQDGESMTASVDLQQEYSAATAATEPLDVPGRNGQDITQPDPDQRPEYAGLALS